MNPTAQLLQPEVRELIQQAKYAELREVLENIAPADVADILADLEPAEAAVAFRILPHDTAGEVFSYIPAEDQEVLIRELGAEGSLRVVEAMDPDDRARLIDEMPAEVAQRLLAAFSPEDRREVQAILGYPPQSVGRHMTPDYVALRPEWTAAQAMEHIRRRAADAETISTLYVTDDKGVLVDDLRLTEVFLADPAATIESLMDRNFVSLRADQDQEEAVHLMGRYDRTSLPVVDSRGVLLGIITADDVADVAEEEATEDIQKLGGVAVLEDAYSESTAGALYRKRIGWLVALVGVNLISSGIIAAYEETLAAMIALAFFLPLLIDSGGNVGSQAATLMVRALATGDLDRSALFATLRKELAVGLAMGVSMGVASALLGIVRGGWEIGLVVGLSMVCIVVAANIIGTVLPFILTRLRLDPAVASSPLITTIADSAGLLIYFSIASAVLRQFV